MKTELEDFIHNNREAFDNRMPDHAMLERIQQQMQADGKKKEKAILIPMKVVRWAAACLILLAGGATFWILQREPIKETTITAKTEKHILDTPQAASIPDQQVAVIKNEKIQGQGFQVVDQELSMRKQVLFAKLTNMESPSQRLTAATEAYELKNNSNDIVDALVKTMNSDPSTNVRLAALDALAKFYRESYVKKQLITSLKKQNDPMVQIGLIELLTKMKESSILTELDKIVKDGSTMEAVKDHAYASILTLRS